MASVQEHYDGHLGPIYGWMLGDFDSVNVKVGFKEIRLRFNVRMNTAPSSGRALRAPGIWPDNGRALAG